MRFVGGEDYYDAIAYQGGAPEAGRVYQRRPRIADADQADTLLARHGWGKKLGLDRFDQTVRSAQVILRRDCLNRDLDGSEGGVRFLPMAVAFAGRWYTGVRVRAWHRPDHASGGLPTFKQGFAYNLEQLPASEHESLMRQQDQEQRQRLPDECRSAHKIVRFLEQSSFEDPALAQEQIALGLLVPSAMRNDVEIGTWAEHTGISPDKVPRACRRSPARGRRLSHALWIEDPILGSGKTNLQFYRCLDPYTAYQELSQFIGGIMAGPERGELAVSEANRLRQKGFDPVYGFRRRPEG